MLPSPEFTLIDNVQIGVSLALWGCAMQSGANNFACMLVGRIVAGFAIGYAILWLMTKLCSLTVCLQCAVHDCASLQRELER